jgi:ubiquinone/menaquinone biosynthesis C-methylase UbiE
MNSIEYWAMNNPLRGFVQRHYEAPRLRRLLKGTAGDILEIGCGQGTGARIIYDLFTPQRYVGIDLDPRMIRRAIRRSGTLPNTTFLERDVTSLEFPDATFDLVLDFGILHHVPDWRNALAEVHRMLRPGGEFLFEDLSAETWERGIGIPFKRLADHPYDEMFTKQEFVNELKALGFDVETHESSPFSFYYFWGRAERLSSVQTRRATRHR